MEPKTRKTKKSGKAKKKAKVKGKARAGVKNVKKTPYKRGSLKHAVYDLFDRKGVDVVDYQTCEDLAKSIMPTTKFNRYHFSWYKNKYRQDQEIAKASRKRQKK